MKLIFVRDKHMAASDLDDGRLVLQASLNDTDQILELQCIVSYPDLVIRDASMTFLRYPGRECLQAQSNIEKLPGLKIERGYNKKVKDVLGGSTGCVHMVDLAIEIGHVAIQAKLKRLERETKNIGSKNKKQTWNKELQGQCVRYKES